MRTQRIASKATITKQNSPGRIIFLQLARRAAMPARCSMYTYSICLFSVRGTVNFERSQVGNTTVRELWGLEPMVWKRAYDFSFNLFVFFIPLLVIIISYCLIHLQMIKWVS